MTKKLYAEIVVDNKSKNTDLIYTYSIPDKLINIVKVGIRVLVPFGNGDRLLEGIIVRLNHKTDVDVKIIKDIDCIVEEVPVLSRSMLNLALWIKKKYLATYIDVFRTILPTGIFNKEKKLIKLTNIDIDNKIKKIKSKNQIKIVKYLNKKNKCYLKNLKKELKIKNIYSCIKALQEKQIIYIEKIIDSKINKVFEKYVYIEKNSLNKQQLLNLISNRAYKQKQIIEYLYGKKKMKLKKIMIEKNCSLHPIKELEKKGLVKIINIEIKREPIKKNIKSTKNLKLNLEQKQCLNKICKSINTTNNYKFLLHGVTGSGKTEIYLQLIENILSLKKQSIVLVPEISLTPQTVRRFVSRFGDRVAVLHSRLSLGERYDEWRKIKENEVDIVIGARSAVFAPFKNLGLIVIDEEHETSYKSSMNPKYDTIEVAEKRCELDNATLLLGSATPSIETYYRAKKKDLVLLNLKNRVNNRKMPSINVIDMRDELEKGNKSILSKKLYSSIKKNIYNNKQTILFLNRRGFSTFVSCRKCGHVIKCNKCDISLTYHKSKELLECHYCGLTKKLPKICPECKSKYIKYFGVGTEKVEQMVKKLFPKANIARMDVDTTTRKGSHEKILSSVRNGEIDILIGTQMIAKGLDFPNVTLVGIIAADLSLNLPDYKSSERTFQLITQVSGRAGRGKAKGEVILQTYQPEHYSIIMAKRYNYIEFYNKEIMLRKTFQYPPYTNIINIIISSKNENILFRESKRIYYKLLNDLKKQLPNFSTNYIFGPNPAPISKIKDYYRRNILIKCSEKQVISIKDILYRVCIKNNNFNKKIKLSIDINPNSIL